MMLRLALVTLLSLVVASCGLTEQSCIDACGDGCPAPEFQTCASDGKRYCSSCVIECKGLEVAEDMVCEEEG